MKRSALAAGNSSTPSDIDTNLGPKPRFDAPFVDEDVVTAWLKKAGMLDAAPGRANALIFAPPR